MAQLYQIKQKPQETVSQWGARIESIKAISLDNAAMVSAQWEEAAKQGQQKTIMLLSQTSFVNGLMDERIRTQMQIYLDTDSSMKETIDKAIVCETNIKSQTQQKFNNRTFQHGPNNFSFKQGTNQNFKKEQVNQISSPFASKYFQCGKTGHMKRHCRAPYCQKCKKVGHTTERCQEN